MLYTCKTMIDSSTGFVVPVLAPSRRFALGAPFLMLAAGPGWTAPKRTVKLAPNPASAETTEADKSGHPDVGDAHDEDRPLADSQLGARVRAAQAVSIE